MINQSIQIPNEWSIVELEKISSKITDGSHNPPQKQDKGLPMLSARNIEDDYINFTDYRLISEIDFQYEDKRTQILPGDVLLTIVGTIGRSCVVQSHHPKFTLQRSVAVITTYINSTYLSYYLHSPYAFQYYKSKARGTAQKGIYLNNLQKMPIPVAPFNEQIRIVSRVEELFSQLDAGVRSLQITQTQLKQYREKTLKHTFSNLLNESAKIPIKKIMQPSKNRFDPKVEKTTKYIGLGDIESNTGKILRIGKSNETKSLKSAFNEGDLLYGRLRPYLNKVVVPDFNGVCSTDILVFEENELFKTKFIQYLMLSSDFVEYASKRMSGVQHPRIKYDDIAKYQAPLPNLKRQQEIIDKIEYVFSILEKTQDAIKISLEKSQALRSSILNKAFLGQLVDQNSSDEPASDLLKRIYERKKNLIRHNRTKDKKEKSRNIEPDMNEPIPLLRSILIKQGGKLTPLNLYKLSSLSIDDFYSKLREEIDEKLIIEIRPNNKEVFLEASE